jgi:hypothetical protein
MPDIMDNIMKKRIKTPCETWKDGGIRMGLTENLFGSIITWLTYGYSYSTHGFPGRHRDFDRCPKTFQPLKNIGKKFDLLINSGSAFKWQVLSQGQVLSV